MGKVLVALDRDGTLIKALDYPGKDDNWRDQIRIYQDVPEAIGILNKMKIPVVVISNQAGVARGYFTCDRVIEINDFIDEKLKSQGASVDHWYFCPFVGIDYAKEKGIRNHQLNPWVTSRQSQLEMRKPGIGMLRQAARDLDLTLEELSTYVIGDKIEDVVTGINANGKGILVTNGDSKHLQELTDLLPQYPQRVGHTPNLLDAVNWVIHDTKTPQLVL